MADRYDLAIPADDGIDVKRLLKPAVCVPPLCAPQQFASGTCQVQNLGSDMVVDRFPELEQDVQRSRRNSTLPKPTLGVVRHKRAAHFTSPWLITSSCQWSGSLNEPPGTFSRQIRYLQLTNVRRDGSQVRETASKRPRRPRKPEAGDAGGFAGSEREPDDDRGAMASEESRIRARAGRAGLGRLAAGRVSHNL